MLQKGKVRNEAVKSSKQSSICVYEVLRDFESTAARKNVLSQSKSKGNEEEAFNHRASCDYGQWQ